VALSRNRGRAICPPPKSWEANPIPKKARLLHSVGDGSIAMKKYEKMLTSTISKTVMLVFCIISTMFCIGVGCSYDFVSIIAGAIVIGSIGTMVTGYSILQDIMYS
jgi:hypothetical protein